MLYMSCNSINVMHAFKLSISGCCMFSLFLPLATYIPIRMHVLKKHYRLLFVLSSSPANIRLHKCHALKLQLHCRLLFILSLPPLATSIPINMYAFVKPFQVSVTPYLFALLPSLETYMPIKKALHHTAAAPQNS